MKETLVLLLALCVFTAAMVPREKRAVNTEEEQPTSATVASSSKATGSAEICQPHTPCAWTIYKPITRIIDSFVANNYCICSQDTTCVANEDDKTMNAYVHRCREPGTGIDIDR